jgi:subtilisin family serine protease
MTMHLTMRKLRRSFGRLALACGVLIAALVAGHAAEPAARVVAPATLRQRPQQEHLTRLGIGPWHQAGFRGRGIKVAVLDSGFRGYRDYLGRALPAQVTIHSFRSDGNLEAKDSQHGILCGEVLHALVPEAELLFANWEADRPDRFLEAVRWARHEGARIISCSVIMPSWSDGEGGGSVHEALRNALGSGAALDDVLCFASAGNLAHRHWSGTFHAGTDGWHEWVHGQTDNDVRPWESDHDHVSLELFRKPGADYRLTVYDRTADVQVGSAPTGDRRGHSAAVVRFQPRSGHEYVARVRLIGGRPQTFHLVGLGADLAYASARGSVAFPADGPEVIAVGAVNREGLRMSYSACGPNSLQQKPDFVAPVPFPSLWRPRAFAGTSAAAPEAAALAALLWSSHPDWTANQVRTALRTSAHDLGVPGPDWETGYGLISLPPPTQQPSAAVDRRPSALTAAH